MATITRIPAAAGATVMGTGIVSIVLRRPGVETISDVLLWVAAALWAALAPVAAHRLRTDPRRVLAGSPGSLTAVAGTCVLGTRLANQGWTAPATVLLVLAALGWPLLLAAVLRHRRRPAPGAAFLTCVATEGLAVLGAKLATGWLLWPALAAFAAGLVLYLHALQSFDRRELLRGAGDQWVAGGALAISALAATSLAAAAAGGLGTVLGDAGEALWVLAIGWLPALIVGELARPRPGTRVQRWATVFPVGMYAAMSQAVGRSQHHTWMGAFGRAWSWIALALWLVVAVATVSAPAGSRAPTRVRLQR